MKHLVRLAWSLALLLSVTVVLFGCDGDKGTGGGGGGGGSGGGGGGVGKTVVIGGKTWMAENMNIKTDSSWCFGEGAKIYDSTYRTLTSSEVQANCNKYGRLYTWSAAVKVCQSNGWRLPSNEDWNALELAAGESVAGKNLKSVTGWDSYDDIVNTNKTGFSALPGGYYHTEFYYAGQEGHWWSSSDYFINIADSRRMEFDTDSLIAEAGQKSRGYSVRCVKD